MKYSIMFTVIGLFCLAGSKDRVRGSIPVDQIRSGQALDKAQEKTFRFFFDQRMYVTNKKWGPCDILLATDSFIYFGRAIEGMVTDFYKVRANEVLAKFPLSITVDGDSVRNVAERFFSQRSPQARMLLDRPIIYVNRPIIYRDNGIMVKLSKEVSAPVWHTPNRTKIVRDSVLLSKTDLSIIQ